MNTQVISNQLLALVVIVAGMGTIIGLLLSEILQALNDLKKMKCIDLLGGDEEAVKKVLGPTTPPTTR